MLSKTFTVLLGIYQILACQIQQPKLWCGCQRDVSSNLLYKNLGFEELPILNIDRKLYNPTSIPRGFLVEMMWKRRFHVVSTRNPRVVFVGNQLFFICSIKVCHEMQNYVGRTFNSSKLYSQLLKYSKLQCLALKKKLVEYYRKA